MDASQIRCQNDLALYETLLTHPDVKRAREQIDKLKDQGYVNVRRRLLATSVRLSRSMAPPVHAIADECAERLGLELTLELYVYASPQFNAACLSPEDGRLFVMFSSSLLESFADRQLCFVVGHEIGHHIYRHHEIPIGLVLNGPASVDPRLTLDLFAWSRYAEFSADRAGAHCADDVEAVARALFRLASGLNENIIHFSLAEFLGQIDDLQIAGTAPGQGPPREDWFSTHPFSPLRVKALQLFNESELARPGGMSRDDLEIAVQSTMSLMEPSYLEGKTAAAEAMRRLLHAGTIAIAQADGEISAREIELFEQFFGQGSFHGGLDIARIISELPGRIDSAKAKTSVPQRMQVVRDLCLVARRESVSSAAKRRVLEKIAADLGVAAHFVEQCLCGNLEPD